MLCHCYLRKGVVYIPTLADVEPNAGHRNIEPVAVVPVFDTEALRSAFHETIARGNPKVPTLKRADYPPPIMPKYARVKTWSAFERGTLTWMIKDRGGVYKIVGYRKRRDRGWEEDPEQTITFPAGSTVDDVIERMIAILQDKARE